MKLLIVSFLFLMHFSVYSKTDSFQYSSYEAAMKASSRIVFNMESTKAALITTSFSGVSKSFSLDYLREKSVLKNVTIFVDTNLLDTDNSSRDEKMRELCFESEKFPQLIVKLKNDYIIGSSGDTAAQIKIRDKWYPITLNLETVSKEGIVQVKGKTSLSLKGLNIPDPSIWIASVRDTVELDFLLELKAQK